MCFVIHKDHVRKKIAKQDILCYKTIFRDGSALIQDYIYEQGVLNPMIKLKKDNCFTVVKIEAGYHSYSNSDVKPQVLQYSRLEEYDVYTAAFKIPKGTGYYFNPEKQEYVSETIIML